MRGHRGEQSRAWRGTFGDRRERGADEPFETGRVGIAHGDHGHEIGAIPVAPEPFERTGIGVFDDVRFADGQAFRVPRATEDHGELFVAQPLTDPQSIPPFGEHHATFGHDVEGVEFDAAGHIAEEAETALEDPGTLSVWRGIGTVSSKPRVGIEVGAEPYAVDSRCFTVVLREVGRAVERHVLGKCADRADPRLPEWSRRSRRAGVRHAARACCCDGCNSGCHWAVCPCAPQGPPAAPHSARRSRGKQSGAPGRPSVPRRPRPRQA